MMVIELGSRRKEKLHLMWFGSSWGRGRGVMASTCPGLSLGLLMLHLSAVTKTPFIKRWSSCDTFQLWEPSQRSWLIIWVHDLFVTHHSESSFLFRALRTRPVYQRLVMRFDLHVSGLKVRHMTSSCYVWLSYSPVQVMLTHNFNFHSSQLKDTHLILSVNIHS